MYSVEVIRTKDRMSVAQSGMMEARTPKEAVIAVMKDKGLVVKSDDIDLSTKASIYACKVCLLGGARESVRYLNIHRVKVSSNLIS